MNIFICQTPFQLFYVNQIIKYFIITNGVKRNSLVFHSNLNVGINSYDNIEYFNLGNESGKFKRFIQFKKAVKIINKIVKTSTHKTDFFLPHTSGLLSNYIFNYKKLVHKNNINLNFFYEGILYFYDYEENFQKFHKQRYLLAVLLGFRYRYNKTILPYNCVNIKHIYTPIKKFTLGDRSKVIEVPFKQEKSIEINRNHYLILGGPISFLKDFYKESINQIINSSEKEYIIYYKGHSSFETHNFEYKYLFSKVAERHNIKFVELNSIEPIELLIEKIKPFKIYSYYSSALLNISIMYPNNFSILCYLDKKNNHFKMFESIFNHFKIDTIFLN